jgi:hypothetical protein
VISRWPFYASVAVLGCECILCFFAGSIEWGERGVMVGITTPVRDLNSAEAAEQARFAIELYAIGALNLLGSIAFLLRRSGRAWWLVVGMQVGALVLGLIEGTRTGDAPGWTSFSILPLLTLILLFAFRKAQARLKPPVERNLTPYLMR